MKKFLFGVLIVLVLVVGVLIGFMIKNNTVQATGNTVLTPTSNPGNNSTENKGLAELISSQEFVRDLPSGSLIQLNVGEKNYILDKDSVREGVLDTPDLIISIPERYIRELESKDFCEVVKEASSAGDASFDLRISEMSAAFKYASLLKYKDCLGV